MKKNLLNPNTELEKEQMMDMHKINDDKSTVTSSEKFLLKNSIDLFTVQALLTCAIYIISNSLLIVFFLMFMLSTLICLVKYIKTRSSLMNKISNTRAEPSFKNSNTDMIFVKIEFLGLILQVVLALLFLNGLKNFTLLYSSMLFMICISFYLVEMNMKKIIRSV